MPKRVLVVDDDADFRRLLRLLLEDVVEFDVVGEAGDGSEARSAARELDPDVVLLDVNLPDAIGFALAPELAGTGDGGPTIVMTSSRGDETYADLARAAGARAFISKHDLSVDALSRALR